MWSCASQEPSRNPETARVAEITRRPVVQAIDDVVAPYLQAADFMGVIAVQQGTDTPLIRSYGFANLELAVEHDAQSIFMIGSLSKQFTAAAILLLEQDGLLSTEDSVAKHLPNFPHGSQMSIAQLVDHTAGVWDIYSLKSYARGRGSAQDFESVVTELFAQPLTSPPGTAHLYSNGGYALLAAIIERVSGQSYSDFLTKRIFSPLGMRATHDGVPGPAHAGRVSGYDPWGQRFLGPAVTAPYPYLKGSGSLWSSAEDLLTWTRALHSGGVLNADSYAKFTQDMTNGYGYGVSIFERFGRKTVGHDGRVSGFSSDLAHYLADETTIVVLSNVQSVSRDLIRRHVAAQVFGVDDPIPEPRAFQSHSRELSAYVGDYVFGPGFVVYLRERDGRLMAAANEGGWSEIVPLQNELWFSRMLYATVRFETAADGAVTRLVWGQGDNAPAGIRQ